LAIKEFTRKVLPILKREKFDIVIPWNNGWQAFLVKLNRVGKIVAVGQSGLGWDDRFVLYLFPDRFVGFTDCQCRWAKKVNPFVKVVKIPNGVDKRFFENRQSLNLNIEKPVILTVAAYTKIKRLDLAIKGVAKLKKGSLLLVGKGELEKDLRTLANKLLPKRHLFLKAEYQDLHRVYKSANLLTFPSLNWESFGIVMLEAMASGLPVVANDDSIRREIVGEAGVFVDPTNTEEYAHALEKALAINWGNKPRKQAEKFCWDKIAIKYEKLFLDLR
jgi:glycosyltransferase involved in cell wall biosynthesis